jgi:predicted nucleotidyltransferase
MFYDRTFILIRNETMNEIKLIGWLARDDMDSKDKTAGLYLKKPTKEALDDPVYEGEYYFATPKYELLTNDFGLRIKTKELAKGELQKVEIIIRVKK